jgi:hypothetical protein
MHQDKLGYQHLASRGDNMRLPSAWATTIILVLSAAFGFDCSSEKTPNRVSGTVTIDVPGGLSAMTYVGSQVAGSGSSVQIDTVVPPGGDRVVWASVPGSDMVWMNVLSNAAGKVQATGGELRIDARTTAAALLQLGAAPYAPLGFTPSPPGVVPAICSELRVLFWLQQSAVCCCRMCRDVWVPAV